MLNLSLGFGLGVLAVALATPRPVARVLTIRTAADFFSQSPRQRAEDARKRLVDYLAQDSTLPAKDS